MYFVALEWRGSLNVDSMRLIRSEKAVIQYLEELEKSTNLYPDDPRPNYNRGYITNGFYRVYQLFSDSPPKNMKKYFHSRLTFLKTAV